MYVHQIATHWSCCLSAVQKVLSHHRTTGLVRESVQGRGKRDDPRCRRWTSSPGREDPAISGSSRCAASALGRMSSSGRESSTRAATMLLASQ